MFLSKDDMVRIYILLRIVTYFSSRTDHMACGFAPSMQIATSCHEMTSVLRPAHAKGLPPSVKNNITANPAAPHITM